MEEVVEYFIINTIVWHIKVQKGKIENKNKEKRVNEFWGWYVNKKRWEIKMENGGGDCV
jgi:hypothetical protein